MYYLLISHRKEALTAQPSVKAGRGFGLASNISPTLNTLIRLVLLRQCLHDSSDEWTPFHDVIPFAHPQEDIAHPLIFVFFHKIPAMPI